MYEKTLWHSEYKDKKWGYMKENRIMNKEQGIMNVEVMKRILLFIVSFLENVWKNALHSEYKDEKWGYMKENRIMNKEQGILNADVIGYNF